MSFARLTLAMIVAAVAVAVAAPREDQTLILGDGNVAAMGDFAQVAVPGGATTIDLTGKSVIPGLVMVHEHLYYPNGPGARAPPRARTRSTRRCSRRAWRLSAPSRKQADC